jgi:hypothetical protein
VTEPLLDDRGMHALPEQERRTGMPQIVEAHARQVGTPDQSLDIPISPRHGVLVSTTTRTCVALRESRWR